MAKNTGNFISKDKKKSLITVYINNEGNQSVKSVLKDIKKETENDNFFEKITGAAIIFSQLIDEVVKGQLISLIVSLVIIFILMVIFFKSFIAGIISVLPILIAIVLLFGIMGFTGIKLDISTTMLSSIVIGVGIDYTIHFLWKFRELIRNKIDYKDAVITTLKTTGRGIFFNAMSVVVGFSVLLFSSFMPVRFFGFLIILSILTSLIASFTLLPAMILIFKPKFLE
jgi:predicted RND superfamily exporter protein